MPRVLEHPNRDAMAIIHVGLANYCNLPLNHGRENIRAPSHFPDKARPRAICNYSPPHHIARKCSSIYWNNLMLTLMKDSPANTSVTCARTFLQSHAFRTHEGNDGKNS